MYLPCVNCVVTSSESENCLFITKWFLRKYVDKLCTLHTVFEEVYSTHLVQAPATPISLATPQSPAALHTASSAANQLVTECELMNSYSNKLQYIITVVIFG